MKSSELKECRSRRSESINFNEYPSEHLKNPSKHSLPSIPSSTQTKYLKNPSKHSLPSIPSSAQTHLKNPSNRCLPSIPSSNIPSSNIPSSGIPSSNIPSSGIPSSGIPSPTQKSIVMNSFILSFVLITLFVIRVGPFLSLSEECSYHGTQLSTLSPDHLFWLDDQSFIYYDEITPESSSNSWRQSSSNSWRYHGRLNKIFNGDAKRRGAKNSGAILRPVEQRYAVIFDAGSTGTRVSIVVFNVSSSGAIFDEMSANLAERGATLDEDFQDVGGANSISADLILDRTYFAQVKPGLSAYAEDPSAAAQSLDPLLSLVTSVITEETLIKKTPLLLKATAGLRLLPGETADLILSSVRDYLITNYSFSMGKDSVSILDGNDEGIFSWMTINSLLGHLGGPTDILNEENSYSSKFQDDPLSDSDQFGAKSNSFDAFNSVAVLDLGGGSTQVTFTPVIDEYIIPQSYGDDFIIKKRIGNEIVKLYTHSYLGYGLMSARKAILRMALDSNDSIDPKPDGVGSNGEGNVSKEAPPTDVYIQHPCFKSVINPLNSSDFIVWKFEGITYYINASYTEGDCYNYATKFVTGPLKSPDIETNRSADHQESKPADIETNRSADRIIDNPRELNVRDIYAISYYYDRALDAGLIDSPSIRHSVIKVKKFLMAGKKACKKLSDTINHELLNSRYLRKRVRNSAKLILESIDSMASDYDSRRSSEDDERNKIESAGRGARAQDPFLCLDLSYIAAFLKEGLQLNLNKDIHVANQVNGVEASWSLGAAYDLFYQMDDRGS